MWNFSDKKIKHRIDEAHFLGVTSIAITSDNQQVVSCSKDRSIAIWNLSIEQKIHTFEDAHDDAVTGLCLT